MQYELTEEQKMLKAAVRKLAEEQIAPGARERDEKEEFSWEMVRLLRDGGYLGIDFPAEYGGGDAGMLADHCCAPGWLFGSITHAGCHH